MAVRPSMSQSRDFYDARNSSGGQEVKTQSFINAGIMEDTEYVKQLNEPARRRYREKITAHIGYDPYQLKKSDFSRDLSDLPAVADQEGEKA
ncbi:hypothetical protein NQZ68_022506 [Dissostichus eleginoides]|nr:hypothetical protein NQZ68_022506 [Dissostichus eleginoides]